MPAKQTGVAGALHSLVDFFADFWPLICSVISIVFLTVSNVAFGVFGTSAGGWFWLMFFIGLALAVLAELDKARWAKRNSTLQLENKEHEAAIENYESILGDITNNYVDLLSDQLGILSRCHLNLTDGERISVYKHDGSRFVMLGRYSDRKEFDSRGRGVYSDTEGCIAEAWRNGISFIEDLPDPTSSLDAYLSDQNAHWSIKKGECRKFRMKSRSYCAIAIEEGQFRTRIAVVVVESISPSGALDATKLREVLNSHEGSRISSFLMRMKPIEPSLSFAKSEGY